MNLQNGGSLDVVCSSERKKSGSTLRPHQHPGRGKAVGGHRAPSLCPSEAAQPRLGYKHCFISLSRLAVSHNRNREVSQTEVVELKSHKRKWSNELKSHKRKWSNSSLTNGSGPTNSSLTNGSGRTQVSQTEVVERTQVSQTEVVELKSHKR
jgi:hypothetical protein